MLIKWFTDKDDKRGSFGKLAGWVGIISNLILFAVKFIIGLVTSSISIMTDAINNLTDSSSSIITIIGFKLSSKPADDEHPYGHARFEYISGMLVSCVIFMVGIQFFINSLKKTINPEPTSFNLIVAILLVLSILLKIWQSGFYRKLGDEINSNVLIATSVDSRNDVLSTTVLLISSTVEHFTGWYLDGPMGMLVSVFVIYSSIELLKDTLTPLLGQAPKKKLVKDIKDKIRSYPSVIGVHDLMVHNYGPDSLYASAHVEISAEQDIMVSHEIIDTMERDFLRDDGINMVIHLDPVIINDPFINKHKDDIIKITKEIDPRLDVHDFRLVRHEGFNRLIFDVEAPSRLKLTDDELREIYQKRVDAKYDDFYVVITVDRNYISTVN